MNYKMFSQQPNYFEIVNYTEPTLVFLGTVCDKCSMIKNFPFIYTFKRSNFGISRVLGSK